MRFIPSLVNILSLPGIVGRQWWSCERLRSYQESRLRAVVAHAYENVSFYRGLWSSAGVRPEDVRTLEDLGKLPVVPSVQFKQARYEDLLARGVNPRECLTESSTGTTGRPFPVTYTRRDYFAQIKAMSVRHYRAHGVRLTDKLVAFGRSSKAPKRGWYEHVGVWRRLVLCGNADAGEWIGPLRSYQPDVLAGLPMTLLELARELRRQGARGAIRPRLVFASGARLEPQHRQEMAETFGARVIDVYGAHEGGFMAWECPQCQAYHLNSDSCIIEVLDRGKPAAAGQTGELVLTSLDSQAMPFVRYGLGDVVTLSAKQPVCGRCLPLIEGIWGRNDDYVVLPSGRLAGLYPIYMCIYSYDSIREWYLVQKESGDCVLQLVPLEPSSFAAQGERIRAHMQEVLSNEVRVELEVVEKIERPAKAKWKSVRSMVKQDRVS